MKQRLPWVSVDPALPKAENDRATMAKIKGRCKILANGCWQFQGFRNRQGYGFTSYRGKPWSVHRLVLMIAKGPIPKKLKACHSCDYPPCANPDHVFAGTSSQNTRDSVAKKRVPFVKKGYPVRTSCKNGHPMTLQADVYLTPEGYRRCRRCRTAAVGRFVKRLIQSETAGDANG